MYAPEEITKAFGRVSAASLDMLLNMLFIYVTLEVLKLSGRVSVVIDCIPINISSIFLTLEVSKAVVGKVSEVSLDIFPNILYIVVTLEVLKLSGRVSVVSLGVL